MVRARMPARSAAAIWLRIRASSGEMITVGPAPSARRSAVATKYTADLPHPVRCTTRARRRSAASARMAVHWSSRSRAESPARARRWDSAASRMASWEGVGESEVTMSSLVPEPAPFPGAVPAACGRPAGGAPGGAPPVRNGSGGLGRAGFRGGLALLGLALGQVVGELVGDQVLGDDHAA